MLRLVVALLELFAQVELPQRPAAGCERARTEGGEQHLRAGAALARLLLQRDLTGFAVRGGRGVEGAAGVDTRVAGAGDFACLLACGVVDPLELWHVGEVVEVVDVVVLDGFGECFVDVALLFAVEFAEVVPGAADAAQGESCSGEVHVCSFVVFSLNHPSGRSGHVPP